MAKIGSINGQNGISRMTSKDSRISSASQQKMKWGSIWIATVILFLVAVQFSVYLASLWPYMSEIDKSVTQTFYGFALASYSAGQMIAAPLFGYLGNRLKQARLPLFIGVSCSLVGNTIYIFTEAAESNRKWIILVARLFCGFGGGIAGTTRAYLASSSTVEQRSRAIAIGTASLSLGVTAGPIIQAGLSFIGYPGFVGGPFHISQYTAPSYVSIIACLIALTLLCTAFHESNIGLDENKSHDPYYVLPKYDTKAALICIVCWFSMFFLVTNNEVVGSPYTMAVFDWTRSEAVRYNSIIMGVSSVLSFAVYAALAIWGNKVNERLLVLIGLNSLFFYYAITFPWPFFTGKLNFKPAELTPANGSLTLNITCTNCTEQEFVGCDPEMEWCSYTPRLPLGVYLGAQPFVSMAYPLCNVAVSTLYSKILGPRRQGFMQSLMIMSGSCARLLGPILISFLFVNNGPSVAWTMTAAVITVSICMSLISFDRLVPLNTKPNLKAGQKINYDKGTLYRC